MEPPIPDPEPANDGVPVPAPGDRIEQYVLQRKLGQGVSCQVFRAWDEKKQIPVAVKIVNWANVHNRDAALKQMRTEAAALSRVRHPRIVSFVDFGFDARWPYLVLEFIEGRPLGELIRAGGALPADWSFHLLGQILEGLSAVWKAGIVHRDVKPDNILVGPTGIAKLIDFGLAKADILQTIEGRNPAELAGTAAYLAPEQARDAGGVDLRADIYSLGATLYESLSGRLPFEARGKMQMILQHLSGEVKPPRDVNVNVPELASDLCVWMLAKNPADRPQNDAELREAFATVIRNLESTNT